MNDISKSIMYAQWSYNPATGCLKNCSYCYAKVITERFKPKIPVAGKRLDGVWLAEPGTPFPHGFEPTWYEHRLQEPARKKDPALVFVGDMADLWSPAFPDWARQKALAAMVAAPHHVYLCLSKTPQGYPANLPPGVWPGTTIERGLFKPGRLAALKRVHADLRWLSVEPLLGDLRFAPGELDAVGWVVVGSQTGNRGPLPEVFNVIQWARAIVDDCDRAGVPVFMKTAMAKFWAGPLRREFPSAARGYLPYIDPAGM